MLSSQDVRKVTLQTLKISEESDYRKTGSSSFHKSDNLEKMLEPTEAQQVALSSTVESSGIGSSEVGENSAAVHYPSYLELEEIIRKNETVVEMYKICLSKIKDLQDEKELFFIMEYFADIIYPTNIIRTADNMKFVVSHIQTITSEGTKLKQILRSNVLNDVWRIKKEYHRTVVNFFKFASDIVIDVEALISSLESIKDYKPESLKLFQEEERKCFAMLNEYMEALQYFNNFMQQLPINPPKN